MVNEVKLIGHLGKDPDVRKLENGTVVAKFSMATTESYKDKNDEWQSQTEWHDIILWRHLAERAERDLAKGKLVYVSGKLTHRKYQDKDGNDRYVTEVVAKDLKLLEKRESSGTQQNMPTEEPAANVSTANPASTSEKRNDAGDDDLPF